MDRENRKSPSQEIIDAQAQLLQVQDETGKILTPALGVLNKELENNLRGEATKRKKSK